MSSHLELKEGIYDPLRQFAITNINDEDYELLWDSKVVARLKPGDTVQLPHHLAVIAAVQIADIAIFKEIHEDEKAHASTPYYKSPKGSNLYIPNARKPYEDRIIKEIDVDTTAVQYQVIAAQKREEILSDLNAENAKPVSSISAAPDAMSSIKSKK